MREFYRPVDMRSRSQMTDFLQKHFRYPTMNSWNGSKSYACNLKIHSLGLSSELTDKLYDMIQTQEFFDYMRDLMDDFDFQHNYVWQVRMNGRSGGYLVLYQGEQQRSEYRSYCTYCGQRNFTSITENSNICGRCGKAARVDYINPPMQSVIYPGRGTDDSEDFEDWDMYELRNRVRLVQELDRLADAMVQRAIALASEFDVVDEEYYVPQTRKTLVAAV